MLLSEKIHRTTCPVCNSSRLKSLFKVKDESVSKEYFDIVHCEECTVRFTQDAPVASAIERYYQSEEYISHSNTNKGVVNKVYHWVRKITLRNKEGIITKYARKNTGKLLDYGAGTGSFVHHMQTKGWQVTGLEPSAVARANAQKQYGVNLLDASHLFHLPSASFDVITLWHVLEHVHELQATVARLQNLLKPGGVLFIAVPNYTSFDADFYQAGWAAYDVPRHLYHFSPRSMHVLMALHQMNIRKELPMWFDSTYVSMLSEQYLTGKKSLFKAAVVGMQSNSKALFNAEKTSSVIYVVDNG